MLVSFFVHVIRAYLYNCVIGDVLGLLKWMINGTEEGVVGLFLLSLHEFDH